MALSSYSQHVEAYLESQQSDDKGRSILFQEAKFGVTLKVLRYYRSYWSILRLCD